MTTEKSVDASDESSKPEQALQTLMESKKHVPMEAFSKPSIIPDNISQNLLRIERSLKSTQMRARTMSMDKDRANVFSQDHNQKWRNKKAGPMLEQPDVPLFAFGYLGEAKMRDQSLDVLKSEIIARLIEQFEKIAYIVNPKKVTADQYMEGHQPRLQNAVQDYARTMVCSVLNAFDGSEVTEQYLLNKAKLQRYEFFITQVIKEANQETRDLFDKVMHSQEFAKEQKLEPVVLTGETNQTFDDLQKQIKEQKEKIKALEAENQDWKKTLHKTRMDSMKEIQHLRETIYKAGNDFSEQSLLQHQIKLNIKFFNPLDGISAENLEIFNQRLRDLKRETDIQVTGYKLKADGYLAKINVYKQLSKELYGLVDTPLPDLFKSISIVEPRAYPVFKALLDAYPPFHFTALIFEYANGDKNENDQYQKLIEIVEESQKRTREKQDETIQDINLRLVEMQNRVTDKTDEIVEEREKFVNDIQELKKLQIKKFNLFVEETQIQQKYDTAAEVKRLNAKLQRIKAKINRIRSINSTYDLRRLVQKWKLSTLIMRHTQKLSSNHLDLQTFKTQILQDIKGIYRGTELTKLQNSIDLYRERLREQHVQNTEIASENFELRAKVNSLIVDREVSELEIEKLQGVMSEQEYVNESLNLQLMNAKEENKAMETKLKGVLVQFQNAVNRVDELEEKYGLKEAKKLAKKGLSLKRIKMLNAKQMIKYFQQEIDCMELKLQGKMQQEKKAILVGSYKLAQKTQTELTGKQIEYTVKPFKMQLMDPAKVENECQTDINFAIFDYMLSATQAQELILTSGQAMQPVEQHQTDFEFLKNLIEMAKKDEMIFTARKVFLMKALPAGFKQADDILKRKNTMPTQQVDQVEKIDVAKKKRDRILKQNTTIPFLKETESLMISNELNSDLQPIQTVQIDYSKLNRRVIELNGGRETTAPEESALSMMHQVQLRSKLESEAREKDGTRTPSQIQQRNELELVTELNNDPSDALLAQFKLITQLSPKMFQELVLGKYNVPQEPTLDEIKIKTDQQTAIDCFEMYAEMIRVLKDLDPSLFKMAIQIVKERRFPDFELKPAEFIKKLYPDFVPDVFTRLWETRLEPKEALERRRNQNRQLTQWQARLQDQQLLDLNFVSKRAVYSKKVRESQKWRTKNSSQFSGEPGFRMSNTQRSIAQMLPIGIDDTNRVRNSENNTLEGDSPKKTLINEQSLPNFTQIQSLDTLPMSNRVKTNSNSPVNIQNQELKVMKSTVKRRHQRILSERCINSATNDVVEGPEPVQAKILFDKVFPSNQLMFKQTVGPFRAAGLGQDLAPSAILLRSKQKITNVEQTKYYVKQHPPEAQTYAQTTINAETKSNQDLEMERVDETTKRQSAQGSYSTVSQLRPYLPKSGDMREKRARPFTSKGRVDTTIFENLVNQQKKSEVGLVLSEQSDLQTVRPSSGKTTNVIQPIRSRVSMVAGGGFNAGLPRKSTRDIVMQQSDTSLGSFRTKKKDVIALSSKEFNIGLKGQSKPQWFQKEHGESNHNYVKRLKLDGKPKRPGTAYTQFKQSERVSRVNLQNTIGHTSGDVEAQQLFNDLSSSLKVETIVNSNKNMKKLVEPNTINIENALKMIQSGSSIGEANQLVSHYYSEQNSIRVNPIFSNQMLKQKAEYELRQKNTLDQSQKVRIQSQLNK